MDIEIRGSSTQVRVHSIEFVAGRSAYLCSVSDLEETGPSVQHWNSLRELRIFRGFLIIPIGGSAMIAGFWSLYRL